MKDNNNIIVFDIETQTPIKRNRDYSSLRLSVVVAYFYKDDSYKVYNEDDIDRFIDELKEAELVVGFNLKGFDYLVLENYAGESLADIPTLDILEEVYESIGRRIKLDSLVEASLSDKKTANGLIAVQLWKQGRLDELIDYCRNDVRLTKELYEFGRDNGYLLYRNFGKLEKIPVSWGKKDTVKGKLRDAFNQRVSIQIYYSASSSDNGSTLPKKRLIDIYYMDNDQIVAYCHLRGALRTFNIRRILDARTTNNKYEIAEDFDINTYKEDF